MDIEYSKLLYNPKDPEAIKRLMHNFEEFNADIRPLMERECLIEYIILMYDIASDFRHLYTDYWVRKRQCAIAAGFKTTETGHFYGDTENMLIGKNNAANDMIVRYLTLFNRPDYLRYISFWEILYAEIKRSLGAASKESKEIKDTLANINKLSQDINELEQILFGGSESSGLRNSLYKMMERDKLMLRPEYMAEKIRNKDVDDVINRMVNGRTAYMD
jgi:hypothetical protein